MVTFVLDTPIAPFQRKSYASENRWLKPNPIIIFAKPSPTDTSFSGKVRIILARDPRPGDDKTSQLVIDGKTFTLLNKQDILVTTKPEVPISSKNPVAKLQAKITSTTNGESVRLIFSISYSYDDNPTKTHQAFVISSDFVVDSNVPRGSINEIQRPKVLRIDPPELLFPKQVRLGIVGKSFPSAEYLRVLIGDYEAVINSFNSEFILCSLPPTAEIKQDSSLRVIVGVVVPGKKVVWSKETVNVKVRVDTPDSPIEEKRFRGTSPLSKEEEQTASNPLIMSSSVQSAEEEDPSGESLAVVGDRSIFRSLCSFCVEGNLKGLAKIIDKQPTEEQRQAFCNVCTVSGTTLLMFACGNSHIAEAKYLLEHGADVTVQNSKGITALHLAACNGLSEIVHLLLKAGASPDVPNEQGFTPLHEAASRRHLESCKILYEVGNANVNCTTKGGFTPLHLAAFISGPNSTNRAFPVISYLVEKCHADITLRDNQSHSLPVHLFASMATPEEMQWLLRFYNELTPPPDDKDINDSTILHYAAFAGNASLLSFLLDTNRKGWPVVDPFAKIRNGGCNVLHLVILSKSVESLEALISSVTPAMFYQLADAEDNWGKKPCSYDMDSSMKSLLSCPYPSDDSPQNRPQRPRSISPTDDEQLDPPVSFYPFLQKTPSPFFSGNSNMAVPQVFTSPSLSPFGIGGLPDSSDSLNM